MRSALQMNEYCAALQWGGLGWLQLSQLRTLIILKVEVAVVQARPFLYCHWHPWYVLCLFIAHSCFSTFSLPFLYYFYTISLPFLFFFSTGTDACDTSYVFSSHILVSLGSIHVFSSRISKAQERLWHTWIGFFWDVKGKKQHRDGMNWPEKWYGARHSHSTGRIKRYAHVKICLEMIWSRTGIGQLGTLGHEGLAEGRESRRVHWTKAPTCILAEGPWPYAGPMCTRGPGAEGPTDA